MFLLHPNYAHTAESFSSYKLRSHSRGDHLTSLTSGIHLWHQNSLPVTVKVWIKAIHTQMHSPFPLISPFASEPSPDSGVKGGKIPKLLPSCSARCASCGSTVRSRGRSTGFSVSVHISARDRHRRSEEGVRSADHIWSWRLCHYTTQLMQLNTTDRFLTCQGRATVRHWVYDILSCLYLYYSLYFQARLFTLRPVVSPSLRLRHELWINTGL